MTDLPGFATRADAVAEQLRQAIMSGTFPAGTRLRQAEIAQRFGVSTTPVREAFLTLSLEGYLEGDPHKGMTVRRPNVRELTELYEIRIALEPLATAKAAERITRDDLADLERILKDMRAVAAQSGDEAQARHVALNTKFHTRIYVVADRPQLVQLIQQMRTKSEVYLRKFPVELVAMGASDDQHEEILEALRSRAPRRAERAMREHLRFGAEHLAEQLRETAAEELTADG